MVEPISTSLGIAKMAAELGKKLYELGKSIKDHEIKHKIDEILDEFRDLKQSAADLEDENRDLREKLRFKSDEYEFRNPFWYKKGDPKKAALCPTCFASNIAAPMGRGSLEYPICLVCGRAFKVGQITGASLFRD